MSHDYELHPLCTLFPRLAEAELEALAGDIAANGLREPITLHDGLILDGGNRYRACLLAGVEPTFKPFDGSNLVSFVLSANLHRRHLSAGQQAAIVASAQDWATAHQQGGTGANQHAKEQTGKIAGLQTVAQRAAESGASERTQRMADKVAKADPELAREVAHGKKTLPQAVEQLTGKRPGKPAKSCSAAPAVESDSTPPVDPLAYRVAELEQMAAELLADNKAMSEVFDADEKAAALLVENKKLRFEISGLRERVNGLMAEKNEAIRLMKSWRKKAEKFEAAAKAGT